MSNSAGSLVEAAIERAILSRDHLRRSPISVGASPGYKEWYHFAVRSGDIDLLLNFSLVDDMRRQARGGAELARITYLVRHPGGWLGDVQQCPISEVRVAGGRLGFEFGQNHVRFAGGAYLLKATLNSHRVEVDLRLVPQTFPSEANNVVVEDGPAIHWMVLPRLLATGSVTVQGVQHDVESAPAYHDHNWGNFRWGRNFAWEWGYALPHDAKNPWSVVMVRLTDRGHNTDLMQGLFLWHQGKQERVFRDEEITVWHDGLLRPKRVYKVPPVMGLISPGRVVDVPARYVMEAKGRGDHARFEFIAEDVAQVIIPNDEDLGVTIINEVFGTLNCSGCVNGQEISIQGASVCEFLGS